MAIASVAEITQLTLQTPGRRHHVNESVVVEIIQDATARKIIDIESQRTRDLWEAWQSILGFKRLERNQPLVRHLIRIFAECHVSQIHKPARREVLRVLLEMFRV